MNSSSLLRRAAMAVALMVGFYVFALAIAGVLVVIMIYSSTVSIKLAAICGIGAIAIIWAILPRFDNFESPGPLLIPKEQPRLMACVEEIAKATNQPVPAEIYLMPDVNAWVANRGGIMGLGSRPVMGLGLPLLQILSVDEFKAVLAHEFGHYHAADTKVGPWVYKTRAAIGRTIEALDESALHAPFNWYGKMFLRVTHKISRTQEFSADALAARVAGSRHVASSLRKVHGAAMAFNAYWSNEVVPVLSAGFRPPIAAGFNGFMHSKTIDEAVGKAVEKALKEGKTDPYDTHPPLNERIAAVKDIPEGTELNGDLAITLIADVLELEKELLAFAGGRTRVLKLKNISWDDTGSQVWMPIWRKMVEKNARRLAGITPAAFPSLVHDTKGFLKALYTGEGEKVPPKHASEFSGTLLSAATTLAMIREGWKFNCHPGDPILLTKDDLSIDVFKTINDLVTKKITPEAFQAEMARVGIAGMAV